jgi:hypothetical protein
VPGEEWIARIFLRSLKEKIAPGFRIEASPTFRIKLLKCRPEEPVFRAQFLGRFLISAPDLALDAVTMAMIPLKQESATVFELQLAAILKEERRRSWVRPSGLRPHEAICKAELRPRSEAEKCAEFATQRVEQVSSVADFVLVVFPNSSLICVQIAGRILNFLFALGEVGEKVAGQRVFFFRAEIGEAIVE